jgi:putative oxidoreductase
MLIILGPLTRLAAIPLIIIMIVAIVSTKVPILLGHDFWIFYLPKLPRYGFRSMMHEARADFDMLLGALYLLIAGASAWSLDAQLARNAGHHYLGEK